MLKRTLKVALTALAVAALVLLVIRGYEATWTGFGSVPGADGNLVPPKRLWDWLGLLIIPAALAIFGFLLTDSRKRSDQRVEQDRQRQLLLHEYFDQLTDLILNHNLRDSTAIEARSIARIRTLSALRGLDGGRKAQLLQFLYEAGLIGTPAVIPLLGADLSGALLTHSTLAEADLRGVHFQRASFKNATLAGANLRGADLTGADLTGCNMDDTDLVQATLRNAKLDKATFVRAKLSQVDLGFIAPWSRGKQLRPRTLEPDDG